MIMFCPDRLGTNTGNVERKGGVCLARSRGRRGSANARWRWRRWRREVRTLYSTGLVLSCSCACMLCQDRLRAGRALPRQAQDGRLTTADTWRTGRLRGAAWRGVGGGRADCSGRRVCAGHDHYPRAPSSGPGSGTVRYIYIYSFIFL